MAAVTAIVAGAGMLGKAIYDKHKANKELERSKDEAKTLSDQEDNLRKNRQAITNPYESVKDLSGQITNPFASIGVATEAAKMQAEEADISLANTLDLMRESGMGAGGATALAQAALRSKKGISASIESQEANVSKMRATGEAQANRERVAEKTRVQQAGVSGELFQFQAQEARDISDLDRKMGKADRAYNREYMAQQQSNQAGAAIFGALASAPMGMGMDLGAFGEGQYFKPGEY